MSMRHGAHEEEEIDRKMELAIPCGLRPDCDAVTVAIESPAEKKRTKKKPRTGTSNESKIKLLESSNATIATSEIQRYNTHAESSMRPQPSRAQS